MCLTTEKMKMFGGPNDAHTNAPEFRNYANKLVDLPQVSYLFGAGLGHLVRSGDSSCRPLASAVFVHANQGARSAPPLRV